MYPMCLIVQVGVIGSTAVHLRKSRRGLCFPYNELVKLASGFLLRGPGMKGPRDEMPLRPLCN